MKIINLNPNQIITLNDYPIRNEQILKLYFRMAQGENKLVPPCPVIHKDLVINNFDTELRTAFNKFYKRNIYGKKNETYEVGNYPDAGNINCIYRQCTEKL